MEPGSGRDNLSFFQISRADSNGNSCRVVFGFLLIHRIRKAKKLVDGDLVRPLVIEYARLDGPSLHTGFEMEGLRYQGLRANEEYNGEECEESVSFHDILSWR